MGAFISGLKLDNELKLLLKGLMNPQGEFEGQPLKPPQERGASEKRAKSPSHYPPQAFRIAFTKLSMSLRAASITGSCPAARKALLVTGPMLAA